MIVFAASGNDCFIFNQKSYWLDSNPLVLLSKLSTKHSILDKFGASDFEYKWEKCYCLDNRTATRFDPYIFKFTAYCWLFAMKFQVIRVFNRHYIILANLSCCHKYQCICYPAHLSIYLFTYSIQKNSIETLFIWTSTAWHAWPHDAASIQNRSINLLWNMCPSFRAVLPR